MTVALLAVAALGLSACGDDAAEPQTQEDDQQVAAAQEFPTGTFEDEKGSGLTFEFGEDGTFSVSGPIELTGTYSIDGDEYVELSNDNPDCKKLAPSPPYTWSFVDERLSFDLEGTDPCGGRWSALRGTTYVRAAGG